VALLVLLYLLADPPPESIRSLAAIARVKPGLTEKLAGHRAGWGVHTYLRLFKEERVLELWIEREDGYVLFATHPICAFSGELGPKLREGDRQAPEGFYAVKPHLMNPYST